MDDKITLASWLDSTWFIDGETVLFYDGDDYEKVGTANQIEYHPPAFAIKMCGYLRNRYVLHPRWTRGTLIHAEHCGDGAWRVAVELWEGGGE